MRRIGQILSDSVPLSAHDVAEILEEQKVSRQRFGDAAMALGFAQPEQVWHAWVEQLRANESPLDLNKSPVDPAVVHLVTARLAVQHHLVPIKARGDELLVGVEHLPSEDVLNLCQLQSGKRVTFIRVTGASLSAALHQHYPSAIPEAA